MKRRHPFRDRRPRQPASRPVPPTGFGAREWRTALADFQPKPALRGAGAEAYFDGWWEKAFSNRPTRSEERGHACGEGEMLTIVAYDITDPDRLRHVAKHCEDYGIRVQYSVFECRLKETEFDRFWQELQDLIEPRLDRLVSYRICARCAQDIRTAGVQEITSDTKPVAYVF